MSEHTKKLDQVRKLLQLATSDNVNEASTAAAQAQKLMTRFSITEAMIEVETADNETEEPPEKGDLHFHHASTMPSWKIALGGGMCRVNQCVLLIAGNRLRIVGRPSDADTARYLFSYVAKEIDRLTKQEAALIGRPGRTWCNNFRLGAADEVVTRLRAVAKEARTEAKQEADAGDTMGTGTALALVNTAIAKLDDRAEASDALVQKIINPTGRKGGGRSHNTSAGRYDGSARAAGRKAGAGIDLSTGGSPSLGSGKRKQLGG